VSPQFQVKFNPTFQTKREGGHQPASTWQQQKCGFVTEGTNKSEKTLLPKENSPTLATPSNQRYPSEGMQDEALPNEANLQREQQDYRCNIDIPPMRHNGRAAKA
jgi:hypothetical protein